MERIPKIIPNLAERLVEEARKQLLNDGYKSFTIRNIAAGCKVASGTIYNYYKSKEMLVAVVILEDWMAALGEMQQSAQTSEDFLSGVRGIHDALEHFYRGYERTFEESAGTGFDEYNVNERHLTLRTQLEKFINILCERFDMKLDEFLITFFAENLLLATTRKLPYDEMEKQFKKLL